MTEKLPLVAMVITAVSCGLQVSSYREPCYHVGSNDYTEYDTETQLCCYGVVYQKNPHLSQGCCGEAGPYNLGRSRCCGNDILPIESPLLCCNNRIAYNDSTHICCGPKTHERHGEGEICCGRQRMNPHEQTCCPSGPRTYAPRDGTGHCCGMDKVYTPQTQICCEAGYPPVSAVYDFSREDRGEILCCGVNFYAPSAQLCCNGVPRQKHAHAACCGDQTYDTLNQVCCDGRVSDVVNGKNKCCGEVAFNPTTEQCCLFNVSPLANGKCCSTESYHPSESSCCQDQIHHGVPEIEGVQKCCGSVSYLETEQVCCNGELFEQQKDMSCCGKDMYNTTTHLCCESSRKSRKTSATQCCGSGVFESTSETCCERANRGFPVIDGKCCHQSNGEVVAYDPRQATCCSGRQREQLYQGTATSDAKCCGWHLLQPDHLCDVRYGNPVAKNHSDDDMVCSNPRNSITYNSKTEVCTMYGTVMLKGEEQRLCRHFLLNPNTHICCQGMIHTKYDTYGNLKRCCPPSVHAYVEEFQSCCAGRVANIPTNVAACCRNTPYDTTTHTCDQSGIARPAEEVERYPNMCGFKPYHPDEHNCCDGQRLVGQGQTCCSGLVFNTSTKGVNTGQCCGIVGFNPDTHICCAGEYLYPRENAAVTCCGDAVWDSSSTEEICCDGVLQPVQSTSGDRMSCSGQLAYNVHRETVCDGVRHLVPHGHCCGQRLFHPELQICCDGLVHQKNAPDTKCCGTLPYNTTDMSTLCCHNSTLHYNAKGKRCCGNQAIDTQQKQCCTTSKNPFIYKTSKEEETCCSSNTAQDTCCHGNLHLNIKDGECCGSAVIRNQEREMCCEGVKVLKEFGEYSICCGQDVIDSRLYSCCSGRAASKHNQGCCNNQVFYTSFQACCGDEVYYNRNTQCCNNTLYDPSVQGCCAQRLYAKGKFECCAGAIFDGANQVCQDGKIGDRERRHSTTENPLCAGNTYNEDMEGCCGGVIYHKEKLACCGGTIYNPIKAVCCGNVISYKRNGACCGSQNRAYNSQRAICCNGVVRKKPSQVGETQCCGTKAYQNETKICCESKVYPRTSNTVECCGNKVFSSDIEICCKNSKIVDADSSYLNPYCYTKLYAAASDAVSEATVWVQKVFSKSTGKRDVHRGKQHRQN